MPELPELEAVRQVLTQRLLGVPIVQVEVLRPIVLRFPSAEETRTVLTGNAVREVNRRGKFLLFTLASGHILAVNPMLTGRLHWTASHARRQARTCLVLSFANGQDLRYTDERNMGMLYVVPKDGLDRIPRWKRMGPEALEVSWEEFRRRLRRHPGQIKNILTNEAFVAGIGNAYADEVLFAAGLYPYRTRTTLTAMEEERLYQAMRAVLTEALAVVPELMGEDISLKPREWLRVHGKGGQPCPRCGHLITQITARQRLTNYCRGCQR